MKKQIALALALATASFAASAGDLSYNSVELGYQRTDIDDLGEGDGFALNGSVALSESLHLFGGYARQSEETSGDVRLDVDLNTYRVGLGYNLALSERLDLVARGAYERVHGDVRATNGVESFSADGKADGYSAEVGVRGLLADNFEGWAFAGYADVSSINALGETIETDEGEDDQFYGRVGAQWKFSPTWGLVGETRLSDEYNQYFVGLRASY